MIRIASRRRSKACSARRGEAKLPRSQTTHPLPPCPWKPTTTKSASKSSKARSTSCSTSSKKDEVDIHSISIERITRQYLDYINTFKLLNIDLASEFIVMAANLMYLKSRTLLPRVDQPPEEDAEEDDPRWELIRQLIEYKKFKDAAGFLSLRELEQEGRFAHQPDTAEHPRGGTSALAEVSIFDLIRAFQNVLKRFEESHDFGDIIDDRFTVSDKIELLMQRLQPGRVPPFRGAVPVRHHQGGSHRHLPRAARADEAQPVRRPPE
jgi:hypothetical protein